MASYPSCRECGNYLVTSQEQEQELCSGCQPKTIKDCFSKQEVLDWASTLPDDAVLCPYCLSVMSKMEGDEGMIYTCRNEMCLFEQDVKNGLL